VTIQNFKTGIPLIVILLLLSGCSIFSRSQSAEKVIVDPLIERNKQWREQVEAGNLALQNKNLERALEAYQAALAIKPNASQIQFQIAKLYFQQEEYERARDAFAATITLDPRNMEARNSLGYIYEQLNNYEAAAQVYEDTLEVEPRNLYALNHLGLAYKQLGLLDEAERALRKAVEIDPKTARPASRNLHNYLGLIYWEKGDIGEAVAEFRESIRLFPKDIWARQSLASLYEEHGRHYEAQLQYHKILEVDPQNLLAPTRLQALAQLDRSASMLVNLAPVDLIDIDIEEVIAAAPDAADYPDADAIILLNQFSHEVTPAGKSRYTSHQVVKILTERGVQNYDDIAIPHTPTAQHITVNVARTILPDGTVAEPPEEAFNDVTPPGLLSYNLYSDSMWRVISMPALKPGVCIEYQVTLEDAGAASVGSTSWFWGGYSFQSTDPILQSAYALRVPKGMDFKWKAIHCQLNPDVLHEEETSTYLWTYGETPALKEEYNMPATNDIVPRLSYSSVESWDSVYNWYRDIAKDRYTVDPAIEETVEGLTADLLTADDKIRAIYHFVASQIRYVGIELGQGAYQPTPADQVLSVRYGDCKDKTTLMITMLDLVGIEAFPVMLNPAPYPRIDLELPSLGQFSHLIAAIPRDDGGYTWLDPTADTCSYGDLPARNRGRTGFVIRSDRGDFVDIPISTSASNRLIVDTQIALTEDGTVQGTMRIDTLGQYNLEARLEYKQVSPSRWKDTFAVGLSKQFPGVRVDSVQISDLQDFNVPVQLNVAFTVENYAEPVGNNHLMFPLPNDEFSDYAEIFAAAERQYPLDLSYPMEMKKTIRITLPEGWEVTFPKDVRLENRFASMERRYKLEGNQIQYEINFIIKESIIPPEDYPAAKRFFGMLVREDRTQLILEKRAKPKT
jgi:tetratricopeptide (TPR) repeat protein